MFLLLVSIEIILTIVALGVFIPCAFLLLECSAALFPDRARVKNEVFCSVTTSILVPAHNESSAIRNTLELLLSQVDSPKNIVVIADNCTDNTAAIARQYGAIVLERDDPQRRGKGYALDYGLQYLKAHPPEVVVVVDADCFVAEKTIERIARLAKQSNKPVQATYLMERTAKGNVNDVISTLAVRVKNLVRPYGLAQLGLPCLLTGSGMAFPWESLGKVSLAHGHSVEDMQVGIDLALAGYPPIFCSQGKITGRLREREAAKSQRHRWEHGHLYTFLTQVPRLLKAAIANKQYNLVAIALEISVLPLSLLVMLWLLTTSVCLLFSVFLGLWLPLSILAIAGISLFLAIFISWFKYARADIPALSLIAIPFYLLWKIPLYFAFLVQPQTQWLKPERED
jgi:cellulose synthase/poly-beta-1,6-N-acetylglucosamine synthase-like glycosyltransferase